MAVDLKKWNGPTAAQFSQKLTDSIGKAGNAQLVVTRMQQHRNCLNCKFWGPCATTPLIGFLLGETLPSRDDVMEAKCEMHFFADWHIKRMEDIELAYIKKEIGGSED